MIDGSKDVEAVERPASSTQSDARLHAGAQSSAPKISWQIAGFLLIADVIGVGVLALPSAFQALGWVVSIISLLFALAMSTYAGMVIGEARALYSSTGPETNSYREIVLRAFGPKSSVVAGAAVYTNLILVNGNYAIVMTTALKLTFYTTTLCNPTWNVVSLCILLPVTQFRVLAEMRWLPVANFVIILTSVVVSLIGLAAASKDGAATSVARAGAPNGTELVASAMTVSSFFSAQALIAFAFSGVIIYCEIIGEMKQPAQFRSSLLLIASPLIFTLYLATGVTGYAFLGSEPFDLIVSVLPHGPVAQASCVLLIFHLLIAFSVNQTIVSAAIHRWLAPTSAANYESWSSRGVHLLTSVALLLVVFVLTNLVSFFNQMTALIGSLTVPFLGFQLPIMVVLKARADFKHETSRFEFAWMAIIVAFSVFAFVPRNRAHR